MSAPPSFVSWVGTAPDGTSPGEVRALRGNRSRASFASMLGVTPLTVYRWELPLSASEARRPRGRHLQALRTLARPGTAMGPPAEVIDDLLAELDLGLWDTVERKLQLRAARGGVDTAEWRALASVALAYSRAVGRSDPGGAIFLVAPLLKNLPPSTLVAARMHLVAGYVFATGDEGLYDAAAASMHAERARAQSRSGDLHALARVIELEAISRGENLETFLGALLAAASELDGATAPVTSCLVSELRAKGARVGGDDAAERQHLLAALRTARAIGFIVAEGRILSRLARHAPENSYEAGHAGR
jgi:DNA-binding transcriptional regulator YiaG